MKMRQAFKAFREPTLTDHMPSQEAFMYLEYSMTGLGWIAPRLESRYADSTNIVEFLCSC